MFGITGDLAAKKIIPALWFLSREGRLPKDLSIVGFARRRLSDDDFRSLVHAAVEKVAKPSVPEDQFEEFFSMFSYRSGSFETAEGFMPLGARIEEIESTRGMCANKLFYLAVPSAAYEQIFTRLAEAKLNTACSDATWSRILIEKPFGHDEASAVELNALLSRYFSEPQVYGIDHYLFKEIVQGIENFRFSNNLFEKNWDRSTIARIDIRLHESIGVESRGAFYESVGTLRDVGQNHVLAMLAAVTMEYPQAMDTESVRKNRAEILKTLAPWSDEQVRNDTYRAQYDGYRAIDGVAPESNVETYFALKTELTHPRWRSVPIYMEAGKRMAESRKEVVLTLKHPDVCYLCETNQKHGPNRITFRLEPNDEIIIDFWTRKPGFEAVLEEREMSFFLYEKKNKVQYVEEYAKVIHAAIAGEQSFFVATQEIEAEWRFVDPVVAGWARGAVPLATYAPGTNPQPELWQSTRESTAKKGPFGIIGLGKMGANLARNAHAKGWDVIGYNHSAPAIDKIKADGITGAYELTGLVAALPVPRTIWLMVPHPAVDGVINDLVPLLEKGDTIIDGGNSPYKDSIRRHGELAARGIDFLDVGVSGGPSGALEGACLMIGGDRAHYERYEELFRDISVADGYIYAGKPGAGHFVKMVHNGIEYGMMQAIAEGFDILKQSPLEIDVAATAEVYNHGSVIESRLIGWLIKAYTAAGADLTTYSPTVAQSGEGQWTVDTAHELGVPVPIIEAALEFRKRSAENPSYTGRVLSALRNQFGGHDSLEK
jgi:glucose-6-phosphate 1-dehydrogenase/6-phosphogluconate dehydrogenase (decarboxylating)